MTLITRAWKDGTGMAGVKKNPLFPMKQQTIELGCGCRFKSKPYMIEVGDDFTCPDHGPTTIAYVIRANWNSSS